MEKLVGGGVVAAKVSSLQLTLLRGEEWTTKNWVDIIPELGEIVKAELSQLFDGSFDKHNDTQFFQNCLFC